MSLEGYLILCQLSRIIDSPLGSMSSLIMGSWQILKAKRVFLPVEQALIQPECGWLLLKQSRHYYTQTRHASHYYRSQAGKTLDPYPISRSLHGPFLYFESQWGENLLVGTILTFPSIFSDENAWGLQHLTGIFRP